MGNYIGIPEYAKEMYEISKNSYINSIFNEALAKEDDTEELVERMRLISFIFTSIFIIYLYYHYDI